MQTKLLLQRLKKLEKKVLKINELVIFFGEPSQMVLNKLPLNTKVLIFVGENEIED